MSEPRAFDPKKPDCIECDQIARLTGGDEIYPHRPDLHAKRFYKCACGAFVGCHGLTTQALGRPGGPKTRNARKAAHAAFDPLWKGKRLGRSDAYKRLADALGIRAGHCHISWFNAEQCAQVIAAVPTLTGDRRAAA